MPRPSLIDFETASSGNSEVTQIACDVPTHVAGDLLVGIPAGRVDVDEDEGIPGRDTWFEPTSGDWTWIHGAINTSNRSDATIDYASYYRFASASEPGSYTFRHLDDIGRMVAAILSFRDVESVVTNHQVYAKTSDGGSTAMPAPSQTAPNDSCLLVCVYMIRGSDPIDPPPEMDVVLNIASGGSGGNPVRLMVCIEEVGAGPTGTRSANMPGFNGHNAAASYVLVGAESAEPEIIGPSFAAAAGSDWAPTVEEGEAPDPVIVEMPFSPAASADYAPSIAVAPVTVGLPFSASGGQDWAPSIDVPSVELKVPFSAIAGADYAPTIIEAAIIAVPFGHPESVEFTPSVVVTPAPIAVPFSDSAGLDYAPAIDITPTIVAVPFSAPAGVDYTPSIASGSGVQVPFSASTGTDWAPQVEVSGNAVAVPFSASTGADFAPSIDEGAIAGVIAVPFAEAAGTDYPPAIERAGTVVEVPFAGAAGIDHAPAVEVGSLIVLVPFAAAAGVEWAPAIRDGAGLPLDVIRFTSYITRTARLGSSIATIASLTSSITRTVRITSEV